jgi:TP901 family phage tail tape measure protein
MPVNAAQLLVTIGANVGGAQAGITGLASMLGSKGMLALAAVGAGAAIAGIGAVALHMAGDFQQGLTTLVTGAGESQSNLGLIQAGVLQMARDTGTSTKQLTDGLYMIESGGYHGAQALDILKAAAEGAKVGASDLGVTADATDTILKNYPGVANGAAGAVNTLIATVAHGKTHMQDLATALSAILPTAAAAGVGLNDVMGAMAAQTAAGVPAADAATHLRQMLIALEAPSSAAKKALEGVGLTTDQVAAEMHKSLPGALQMIQEAVEKKFPKGSAEYLNAMKNISGGMRQMQGMLILTSQTGMKNFSADVGIISKQVQHGGQQVAGWNLVQKNFNQQVARAAEVAETLMIQLGQKLLPVATRLFGFLADNAIPTIENVTKFLSGNSAQSQIVRDTLIVLAIAIAGALVAAFVAWAIAAGAAAVATIAATWPLLLIGAGIALLIAGIILLVTHWGQVTDALGRFKAMLGQVAGDIGSFVGNAMSQLGGFTHNALDAFGSLITSIPGTMLKLGEQLMKALADGIRSGASHVADALKNVPLLGGASADLTKLIPHFASGGVMAGAGFALVGEQGPELVQLPGGAQITPIASGSGQSGISPLPAGMRPLYGAASAASAGGQSVVLQIDGRRIAQAILPYLPDAIRQATGARHM